MTEHVDNIRSGDTTKAISNPFKHCGAGLFIGPMHPKPTFEEFGAVLTVAKHPGFVEDGVAHRHLYLTYQCMDINDLFEAVNWVQGKYEADRPVLIRSEGGKERPALVVAATFIRLGGSWSDAVLAIARADPNALKDFRYRNLLHEVAKFEMAVRR